eukprot:284817461_2
MMRSLLDLLPEWYRIPITLHLRIPSIVQTGPPSSVFLLSEYRDRSPRTFGRLDNSCGQHCFLPVFLFLWSEVSHLHFHWRTFDTESCRIFTCSSSLWPQPCGLIPVENLQSLLLQVFGVFHLLHKDFLSFNSQLFIRNSFSFLSDCVYLTLFFCLNCVLADCDNLHSVFIHELVQFWVDKHVHALQFILPYCWQPFFLNCPELDFNVSLRELDHDLTRSSFAEAPLKLPFCPVIFSPNP